MLLKFIYKKMFRKKDGKWKWNITFKQLTKDYNGGGQ